MKIVHLGDSQARGYAAEISVCFGQDIALQIEAEIAKQNAQIY
jgi:hypothetical protein